MTQMGDNGALAGKVAIVTGSTRGIGRATAEAFAQAGARVAVSSRKPEACEAARAEMAAAGHEVISVPAHVGKAEDIDRLVDATVRAFGRLDVVVCNAAVNPVFAELQEITEDTWAKVMETNLTSVWRMSKAAFPHIARQGGGAMVLLSSTASLVGTVTEGPYAVSKAAENHLARQLAVQWGPKNIRVNTIAPGLTRTDMIRNHDPAMVARTLERTPLRRMGEPSDVAAIALFFASDALHVLAGSIWVGGVACLLLALPGATRRLQGGERSRLLLATLARFSAIALGAVVVIVVTGVIQAYIDVRGLHGLLHTTYGALIVVKVALLASLVGLGWVNRERVIPALKRLVGDGRSPGGIGALARRTMRGELALMLCVFGVTAALVSYAPPIDAASGPFSTNTTIGSAELEMTLEPAKVGLNTIHLYLIDAKTGTQFTATKELTATARLPSKGIGPLPLRTIAAGPGHYVLSSAVLSPGGTWEIEIIDRVSEFEQFSRTVRVPIG